LAVRRACEDVRVAIVVLTYPWGSARTRTPRARVPARPTPSRPTASRPTPSRRPRAVPVADLDPDPPDDGRPMHDPAQHGAHDPARPDPPGTPAGSGPAGPPRSATAPARDLVEVVPGVWVATAEIWTTTSTVAVAPDGEALVVDPAVTVAEVEGLAAAVAERGWRVTAGFATHAHWDHVLWSASLGGAPRWATARAVAVVRRRRAEALASADAAAPGHDPGLVGALSPL